MRPRVMVPKRGRKPRVSVLSPHPLFKREKPTPGDSLSELNMAFIPMRRCTWDHTLWCSLAFCSEMDRLVGARHQHDAVTADESLPDIMRPQMATEVSTARLNIIVWDVTKSRRQRRVVG